MSIGSPTIRELLSLPVLSDGQISSDGTLIAYVQRTTNWVEDKYDREIRIIHPRSSGDMPVREFARLLGISPRWSPLDSELAYLSFATAGMDLKVWGMAGEKRICDAPPGAHHLKWSPCGNWISMIAPILPSSEKASSWAEGDALPAPLELWRINVDSGDIVQWTRFGGAIVDYEWHPQGDRVLCCVTRSSRLEDWSCGDLAVVSWNESQGKRLLRERCRRAVWSPSGRDIAVVRLQDSAYLETPQLEVVSTVGEGSRIIPMNDEFHVLRWDRHGLLALCVCGTSSLPCWIHPETGVIDPVLETPPEGFTWIEGWFGSGGGQIRTNDQLCSIMFDLNHAGEVAVLDLGRRCVEYKTETQDVFRSWNLPAPQLAAWMTQDGVDIEGVLIPPMECETGGNHPLVVVLHGGPTSMSAQAPLADNDWILGVIPQLLQRGCFVLLPNYRGSVGYGDRFRQSIRGKLGLVVTEDLITGIQSLSKRYPIDSSNVGAVGASHGGYLAAFLAAYSNVLTAAVMRSGISDWLLNARLNLDPTWEFEYFGGDPETQRDAYREASVLTYVDSTTAPLLIIHGDSDTQAPTANAKALNRVLEQHGAPHRLLLYHGMGHGGASPTQLEHSLEETVRWFEYWMGLPGPDAPPC